MPKLNINAYVKNATKSVGYVSLQALKTANPVISEFAETNKDFVKELYQTARDYKKILRSGKSDIADNEYAKIAKETAANILDDLRTGKFYNEDREKETDAAMFKGFGMEDFGEFDWDSDWDDDGDTVTTSSSSDPLSYSQMDKVGGKISSAVGRATMSSAQYIVKSNRAASKADRAHFDLLFGKVNNGLATINTTLAVMGKELIPSATAHFANSSEFYKYMTAESAKHTFYLEKIYNLLEDRFAPPKQSYSRSSGKNPWKSIYGGGGSLDLRAYAKHAKGNVEDMLSMFTMVGDMMGSFDETAGKGSTMRKMLASPIAMIMQMGLESVFTKGRLGRSFGKLNNAISGAFASVPGFIKRKSKQGGFWELLGDVLGINSSEKKTVDTSRYEKGRVDWTGKDAKALREVIPTQLSLILAALTGNEPKVFDYETGKWKTYSGVQKEFGSALKRIAYDSQRDVVDLLNKHFVNDAKSGNRDTGFNKSFTNPTGTKMYKTWTDDLISFYNYLKSIGANVPTTNAEWQSLRNKMEKGRLLAHGPNDNGIMLAKNFNRVKQYYMRIVNDGNTGLGVLATANANLSMSHMRKNSFLEDIENSDSSLYALLHNNSGLGAATLSKPSTSTMLTNSIDDKGHNIFFYLQHYYLKFNDIIGYLRNGGGRRSKRAGYTYSTKSDFDNYIPTNTGNLSRSREIRSKSNKRQFTDSDDDADGRPTEETKKSWADKMSDKLKGGMKDNKFVKKIDGVIRTLGDLFGKPMEGFESIVDSVDRNIYEFFYGKLDDGDRRHKGFIDHFYSGFQSLFTSLENNIKDLFRDKINPIVGALADRVSNLFGFSDFAGLKEGIKNSKFVKNTFGELKNAGRFVKSSVKSTFGEVRDFFTGASRNKASRGGYVTKSGMVSVSEGEIILPNRSRFSNIYEMDRIENRNALNYLTAGGSGYWGNFARGGKTKPILTAEYLNRARKVLGRKARTTLENLSEASQAEFKRRLDRGEPVASALNNVLKGARNIQDDIDNIKSMGTEEERMAAVDERAARAKQRAKSIIDPIVDGIANNVSTVFHRLFGDLSKKDGDKDVKATMKSILGDMKQAAPSIAAGGLIGGGVSLVGGLVGGPLLGAAAGAAIGYARKSEKLQKYLFGETDDDGNQIKRGLLGPRLSKLIQDTLPDLSKFGITGGLAGLVGLVPGGPIAGMAVGAGLGLLTKSESVRNYLFGEEGLLGKDGDKKIKKALPAMGLGAVAGALTGPFGLVGNIVVGSAIGYASQTEKFKELLFGVEDENGKLQGGILGSIRKRLIDPLEEYTKDAFHRMEKYLVEKLFKPLGNLFNPLSDYLKATISGIGDAIKGTLNEIVVQPLANSIDRWIIRPIAGVAGRVGKMGMGLVKGAINLTGGTATWLGKGRTRRNIRSGIATSMTRSERAAMQNDINIGSDYRYAAYDRLSSAMSDADLQKHYNTLKNYQNLVNRDKIGRKQNNQAILNQLMADTEMDSTFWQNRELAKYLSNGDFAGAQGWIYKQDRLGNMHGKTDRALKSLAEAQANYGKYTGRYEKEQAAAEESMRALGIDSSFLFGKDSRKFFRLMDSDLFKARSGIKKSAEDIKSISDKAANEPLKLQTALMRDSKNILYQIRNGIYTLAGKTIPDDEGSKINDRTEDSPKVVMTENGKIEYNADGSVNNRDADTNNTIKKAEEDRKIRNTFFTGMTNMLGLLPFVKDKKQKEPKEKKEGSGILGKIGNAISGMLGGAGNLFSGLFSGTGSSFLGLGAAAVGAVGLGAGVEWLMNQSPALKQTLTTAKDRVLNWVDTQGVPMVSNLVQSIASKLGETVYKVVDTLPKTLDGWISFFENTAKNTKSRYDNFQDFVEGRDATKYGDDEYQRKYMTERYGQTLLKKSIILGQTGNKALSKVPVFGKVANAGLKYTGKIRNTVVSNAKNMFKSSKVSNFINDQKAFSTVFSSFKKAGVDDAMQMALDTVGMKASKVTNANAMVTKFIDAVQLVLEKLFSKLGAPKGQIQNIIESCAKAIGKEVSEKGGSAIASKLLKTVGGPLGIAFGIGAFASGMTNARAKTILGIIETPTMAERLIAAALNAINEMIPGIGGLIDTSVFVTIIVNACRILGFTWVDDLVRKRQEAQDAIEIYNKDNDETYNVEEYIYNVQGEATIGRKVSNAVKSFTQPIRDKATGAINNVKEGFANFKDSVKEKGGLFKSFGEWIKEAGNSIGSMASTMYQTFSNPDASMSDVFNTDIQISEDNPLKPIMSGVASVSKIPIVVGICLTKLGVGAKKKFIDPFVNGVKTTASDIGNNLEQIKNYVMNGDVAGLMADSSDTSQEGSAWNVLTYMVDFGAKVIAIPFAGVSMLGHKVKDFVDKAIETIKPIFESASNKATDIKAMIKDMWSYAKDTDKDISGLDSVASGYKVGGDNIMDKIGDTAVTITSGIMKMIVKVIRPILSIADTVGDTVDGVKSAGKNAYNTAKTAVGKAKDSVVSWASDKLDTAKGWINSWAGDGSHVSQYDPRYAGRRFGRHTVADKGCGPAVAASVLRAYGRNSSLGDTINYAEANGYVAGASGTRAGYFNDIFAANGISSAYTDNRKIMKQSIKSGRPTVLLGQDTGNGSKLRSPFGPNPHYVVAHGMDRRGNLIVDDPELGSTALYKNSILNKAKLGVITGGDSGATIDGNTTEAKVWQFFTQNGFTPAATAGIMGSIYQESKFKPDMIQGNGAGPAAGLFQWENYNNKSKRWKALSDFAAARGKNWTDLQTQLEYALHEMTTSEKWMWKSKAHSNYAGVSSLDEYKQITNPVVAAEAFENHFERAGKPMMGVRKQKATEYYNMFSGSKISNPTIFNSSSYSTGNTTSGTDLGSLIGGVFNKVLGAAFGAMGKFGQFLSGAFGLNNGSSSNGLSGVDYTYSGNTGSYSGPDPMKGVGENAVALMRAIEGKNQYSMDSTKREQVFASLEGQKTGYGDCSATVRKVLQKVTGKNIGGNTEDQYVNYASRGGVVVNSGKIDESKLAPGDALYYARPTSSYTVGRKDRVGHVEMYIGNGQRMGHGSGMGPKVSSLDSDSSRFLKAIRFTAAGSGLMNNKPEALNVIDFSKYTGSGSRPVNGDNIASYTRSTMENINSKARRYIGGDSGVSAELISMIAQAVEYLKSINSNTAHNALLAEIVSLMTQLTQVVAATGSAQIDTAEDTDVLRSQTADILNRLTAMAKAV